MENKWSEADKEGVINVPDYLDKLVNKIGMQIRFHTISGKNEVQTICDITAISEEFFSEISIGFLKWYRNTSPDGRDSEILFKEYIERIKHGKDK